MREERNKWWLEVGLPGHRKLWDWLSKNPAMSKHQYPGWEGKKRPRYDCYACEYAKRRTWIGLYCKQCPLIWPNGNCVDSGAGLFAQWIYMPAFLDVRAVLAMQIRDLPSKI